MSNSVHENSFQQDEETIENYVDKEVDKLNKIHKELREFKIKHDLTIGYRISTGGILNAYRECDISFNDAVKLLDKLGMENME